MIGGTRNLTMTIPFATPISMPKPIASRMTKATEAGFSEISRTARNAQKFMTKGIDRSMPPSPVAIGNI